MLFTLTVNALERFEAASLLASCKNANDNKPADKPQADKPQADKGAKGDLRASEAKARFEKALKEFAKEKDELLKDEEVLAGIDAAATDTTNPPAPNTPLAAVAKKLETAYGKNGNDYGTKAAPTGGTGKDLETEQGKLPALKTAVEDAKKALKEPKDLQAAHDKAEAELTEARKGALLDYAATLEKTVAGITFAATTPTAEEKVKYNAAKMKAAKFNKLIVASDDAVRAAKDVTEAELVDYADNTLKAAQKVMQAAKSGHDVAKAIDTAKTALEGEKTKS